MWTKEADPYCSSHCQEENLNFKRAIKKKNTSLKHSKSKQSRKGPKFPNPCESYLSPPESLTMWPELGQLAGEVHRGEGGSVHPPGAQHRGGRAGPGPAGLGHSLSWTSALTHVLGPSERLS